MSQPINSYNVLIDRFAAFAAGHYMISEFSHGQLDVIDIPADKQYPWMHVFPAQIVMGDGTAEYQWQVWFMDLPRDKEYAPEYIRENLADCIRLAQDLIYEIDNGNTLFGVEVDLAPGATIIPEIREFTHTLTGVQLSFSMIVPDDYDACAIPADYAVGSGTAGGAGTGGLMFAESLVNTGGIVTLVNDEQSPGASYYYGTDENGVKGWYANPGGSFNCSSLAQCEAFTDLQQQAQNIEDTYVQSVTGLNTDNTDPQNPVVQISVDGVTITGAGTPGDPLVAAGGGGGGVQSVSGESVDNTDPANPVVNAWPLAGTGAGPKATGTIEVDPAFTDPIHSSTSGNFLTTTTIRPEAHSFNSQDLNHALQLFISAGFGGTPQATIQLSVADIINNYFNGYQVQESQYSDAGTYPVVTLINNRRINFDGVAAPTVNDDSGRGYQARSFWIYDGRLWICTDATTGAAVWNEVGAGGSGITELTGDVTAGPGSGSQVATIADDAVTYAKMQNMPSNHLIGRHTAGNGDPQNINIDGGLELNGANLRRSALTGDVTAPAGSNTTTIANDAVTFSKMQNIDTQRVVGRNAAGTGDPEQVTLSQLLDWVGSAAQGDILYRGASGWERLAAGTSGFRLRTNGAGANPSWTQTVDTVVIAGSLQNGIIPGGATQFFVAGANSASNVESQRSGVIPITGTASYLHIILGSVGQPAAQTLTVTLRVNGADTAVTFVIPAGAAAGSIHTSGALNVAVTQGQSCSIKAVQQAGATSGTISGFGFIIERTA